MPVKKKVLSAVLAAAALCLAAEAFCRRFPSLLPRNLFIVTVKQGLLLSYTEEDGELGYVPRADLHRVFDWRGRRLEVRQAPLPGQSRAGYRTDSRTLGQSRADIVALGDSFTNALEVDQDSTWPSRLGALTGLRVANLGVTGYCPTQEVGLYRRYGSSLRPKLVLLLLSPTDPPRDMFFGSWRLLKGREDPGQPESGYAKYMFCRSMDLSGGACRLAASAGRSGVLSNLALKYSLWLLKAGPLTSPENAAAGRQLLYQDIEDLRSLASSRGAKVCVVINDYWESLSPRSFAELTGFLRKKGIPYLSLGLHAKYPKVKLLVAMDGHWNELGNTLAAVEVHRFLRGNRLLPAGPAGSGG